MRIHKSPFQNQSEGWWFRGRCKMKTSTSQPEGDMMWECVVWFNSLDGYTLLCSSQKSGKGVSSSTRLRERFLKLRELLVHSLTLPFQLLANLIIASTLPSVFHLQHVLVFWLHWLQRHIYTISFRHHLRCEETQLDRRHKLTMCSESSTAKWKISP